MKENSALGMRVEFYWFIYRLNIIKTVEKIL